MAMAVARAKTAPIDAPLFERRVERLTRLFFRPRMLIFQPT
jgi:hypothetical protein